MKIFNLLILSSFFLFSSCHQKENNNKRLNIYNWNDYVDPETVKDFEKIHDVKIKYDYYDSNESLEAKVLTGQSGYDLVFPGSIYISRQIKAGAYIKLDKSKIHYYDKIDPNLLTLMESIDTNNEYAVPYFIGINTLAINKEAVEKRIGSKLPENIWDLIFNEKYSSKLKDCGISILDSPSEVVPIALSYLDLDPASNSIEDIKKAFKLLASIRKNIERFDSATYTNDLARGDICIALGYGGDLNISAKIAKDAKSKFTIKVLAPKTKTAIWIDSATIPIGAENIDNAYLYINYFLDPQVAAKNGNFVTFQPGSKPAKELMDKSYTENPSIFISEEALKTGFIIKPFSPKMNKKIVQLWQILKSENK